MALGLTSCKSQNLNPAIHNELSSYRVGDTIKLLDLSYKKLKSIPDLSGYYISELDISNNKIKDWDNSLLPQGLKRLNASNNDLSGSFHFSYDAAITVQKIDLSNNHLDSVYFRYNVKSVDVSYNDLTYLEIALFHNGLDTINVSNNKDFSNILNFNPKWCKLIIRDNIKNNKEMCWLAGGDCGFSFDNIVPLKKN